MGLDEQGSEAEVSYPVLGRTSATRRPTRLALAYAATARVPEPFECRHRVGWRVGATREEFQAGGCSKMAGVCERQGAVRDKTLCRGSRARDSSAGRLLARALEPASSLLCEVETPFIDWMQARASSVEGSTPF